MKSILEQAIDKLNVDRKLFLVYAVVYVAWGTVMNNIGIFMQIARFTYWWQIITCYLLYMVPVSLLLRHLPFQMQYAYGLVAMGFLEFSGYAIQSSYVYPDNILEKLFTPHNFALGMALFFALYFPVGNWVVDKTYNAIFKPEQKKA